MRPVRFAAKKSKVLAFDLVTFGSYPPSTTRRSLGMGTTSSAERISSSYRILASDCGYIVPDWRVRDNSHIASLRVRKLPSRSCPIFALARIRTGERRSEEHTSELQSPD